MKKLEVLKVLFPKQHPLALLHPSKKICAQLTDEVLLLFKEVVIEENWNFRDMAQISTEGVLKYLDGMSVKNLDLRGCTKIKSAGGIEILKQHYPEATFYI